MTNAFLDNVLLFSLTQVEDFELSTLIHHMKAYHMLYLRSILHITVAESGKRFLIWLYLF